MANSGPDDVRTRAGTDCHVGTLASFVVWQC